MKHSGSKFVRLAAMAVTTLASLLGSSPMPANGQPRVETNKVIPVIIMEDVYLEDAIRNLARMAGINYILDPKLSFSRKAVSCHWENLTAEQALRKVLDEHGLKITPSPATSVARVTSSNAVAKPVMLPPVANNTNDFVPIFVVDEARLDDAARRLGAVASLKISFDPGLAETTLGQTVSFRWESLTARQALGALLDNYDLAMVVDTGAHTARVISTKQTADTPSTTTK